MDWSMGNVIDEQVAAVQRQVGDGERVIYDRALPFLAQ